MMILLSAALLASGAPLAQPSGRDLPMPASVSLPQATPFDQAAMDRWIDSTMTELDMPGLSIAFIDDGEIRYVRQVGEADRWKEGARIDGESMFEMASLSKPVFAYFALKMADQGIIDLDRPLMDYLALERMEKEPAFAAVTARHALSHRTGLPNWRWFDRAPEEMGVPAGQLYLKRAPGEFGYAGEGYRYLARVIAQETGHDLFNLDRLFQHQVVVPLGLHHMSFVSTPHLGRHKVAGHKEGERFIKVWPTSFPDDSPQTFGAAGRLHANAPLYARFLIALMDGEGLSEESHRAMFSQATVIPEGDSMREQSGEIGWTLGLAIKDGPGGRHFAHGGNNGDFQSGFAIWPETRSGYVFVTNSDRGQAFEEALRGYLYADRRP